MSIVIRRARPEDAPAIARHNEQMAWETEDKQLDTDTVQRGVAAVFTSELRGFYLVAEADQQVVGQLMITLEWSDWRNGWLWWIQSVYVEEGFRRQGIFRKLFETILAEAKKQGDVVGIRLYVEKENHIAQKVYQQLMMYDTGYHVFERLL